MSLFLSEISAIFSICCRKTDAMDDELQAIAEDIFRSVIAENIAQFVNPAVECLMYAVIVIVTHDK